MNAVASSAFGGSQQPQQAGKTTNAKGSSVPQSTSQSNDSQGEVTIAVKAPLDGALQCLGGPDAVANAQGLTLITLTFPKP